ncbi:MAG: hypothetical protein HC800_15035 [Phormidesmis sp. RL_2_1]|nr:hypothetical protein [Phormidesmis sp. RL_2_1]
MGWVGLVAAGLGNDRYSAAPWQALCISGLTLGLLWHRLKQQFQQPFPQQQQKKSLLVFLAVAAQAYWLMGGMIPAGIREPLLSQLSAQLSIQPISSSEWLSLGFFPFLWGLLGFTGRLLQWQQFALAKTTAKVGWATGVFLILLGLSNSFTAAMSLLLCTITLSVVLWCKLLVSGDLSEKSLALIHGMGLLTLAAWIHYGLVGLSIAGWARVCLGVAIAELTIHFLIGCLSLAQRRQRPRAMHWQKSTGLAGIVLAGLSYGLMILSWAEHAPWLWLLVPVTLTCIAHHRQALWPRAMVGLTMLALVMQGAWLTTWPIAIASFAVGTLCTGFNSRIWRSYWVAMFTLLSGIACITSGLFYGLVIQGGADTGWLWLLGVIEIAALWLLQRVLERRSGDWALIFTRASQSWGWVLMVCFLGIATLLVSWLLSDAVALTGSTQTTVNNAIAAAILLMAILVESIRYRPSGWHYVSLAWTAAIVVMLAMSLQGMGIARMAIAILALGFITQIAADIWVIRRPPYRLSWHVIPIGYAGLGLWLAHSSLQLQAGLYTLFAAMIFCGIGRRKAAFGPLSYIGLALISIGAYEVLVYQMLQASRGQPGDGFTLLAALALLIGLTHRYLSPWLCRYLQMPLKNLIAVAHLHWVLSTVLLAVAALAGLSQPHGIAIWTVSALLAASYALSAGNRRWSPLALGMAQPGWTISGLVQGLLCLAYDRFVWFPDRTVLLTWGGAIACIIGFVIYRSPWQRWGWPPRPWRWLGLWLPAATVSVTLLQIPTQSVLIVGAFYAWMAKQFDRVRLSYLSVLLFDWALWRYLNSQGWLTALIFSLMFGLSVLYFAAVEPHFEDLSKRQQRHWLRILASGLVGMTALYQAEVYSPMLVYAAITLALGIGLIFSGLALKVRAFLYVGTGTFMLQIVRVLWLFISEYSLLLWAVGIVLGLIFIWIAATFESSDRKSLAV